MFPIICPQLSAPTRPLSSRYRNRASGLGRSHATGHCSPSGMSRSQYSAMSFAREILRLLIEWKSTGVWATDGRKRTVACMSPMTRIRGVPTTGPTRDETGPCCPTQASSGHTAIDRRFSGGMLHWAQVTRRNRPPLTPDTFPARPASDEVARLRRHPVGVLAGPLHVAAEGVRPRGRDGLALGEFGEGVLEVVHRHL